MLKLADLHNKIALKKSKMSTTFILSAVEVSDFTSFGSNVEFTQSNMKHSPLDFRHQHRLKNTGLTTFLGWLQGIHFI